MNELRYREIKIQIDDVLETGIGFTIYLDGKERTQASIGEWNDEQFTVILNFNVCL